MKNKSLFILLVICIIQGACNGGREKETENSDILEEPKAAVNPPPFNSDSAYYFIEQQVDFGPRVPNTVSHKKTGDFLVETLSRYGAKVVEQTFEAEAFDGTKLYLRNIIGSYNLEARKRILLAAHWDTRPFADKDTKDENLPIEGANDGGSGVAVLLEFARIFKDSLPEVGIDIILFDGEDYGEPDSFKGNLSRGEIYWCLGSQYWSENPHIPGYSAYYGILLDMVGAKDAAFYQEGISMHYAPKVVEKVWNTAANLGYRQYFVPSKTGMITDDHVFINEKAQIPTIDIIQYGPDNAGVFFGDYHHTHRDNMDIISKETLKAVGETVLHVIYNE